MPIKPSFKTILEKVMNENKINKTQLAQSIDISNTTLSGLLNGKRKINLALARKLHSKYKIDGNLLLEVV